MRLIRSYTTVMVLFLCIISLLFGIAAQENSTDNSTDHVGPGSVNAGGNNQSAGQLHNYIWILIIVIVVIVLPLSYFLISRNMKQQMEKNIALISQMVHQNTNDVKPSNTDDLKNQYQKILLKFLNYNENRVMKTLIENSGTILQSEISRLPNMGKVKAHRTLNDMKTKGLIDLEPYGKTNKISLTSDVAKIFIDGNT